MSGEIERKLNELKEETEKDLEKIEGGKQELEELQAKQEELGGEPVAKEETAETQQKRSELGKKVAALHRRQDSFEESIKSTLEEMKTLMQGSQEREEEVDDESYATVGQIRKLLESEKRQVGTQEKKYQDDYIRALANQTAGLEDDEYNTVLEHMQAKFNSRHTGNGSVDAEKNFKDAYIDFLKGKKVVSQGPRAKAPGLIQSQETAPKKKKTLALDPQAEALLDSYRKMAGGDRAKKLHEGLTQ